MENSKQQMRRKQEDAALNKLLIWFGVAIVYEAVALLLKRFYVNFVGEEVYIAAALANVFKVLQWVMPVLTVAALVWLVLCMRAEKPVKLPLICTGVGVLVSMTVILAYRFFENGVAILGAVAPVMAVLALVYYLYQKDFFCNTILTGGGIFALWVYRKFYLVHPRWITAGFVLAWVLLAVAVFLAWKLSQSKGKWKSMQLFPAKASYVPTYVTAGIAAVALLAALIFGAAVAYYAIFALVTWLFCLAVYYTVRMM